MRCVAIDWSGRAAGAERHIWTAEARDGRLVDLRAGLSREQAVDRVIAAARADPDLVAGLDFAFSFPGWYCEQRGWHSGPTVWEAIAREGEALLRDCPPPFWGRPGRPRRVELARTLRRTDVADVPGAKSVFQVGGAGAVGTGSIRGMPLLSRLRGGGIAVWPFDGAASPPYACEIYPRAVYGPSVVKSRAHARAGYLATHHSDQPPELLRRAAASEDAFDAAVSALAMSAHEATLRTLPAQPAHQLEGRVWTPTLEW